MTLKINRFQILLRTKYVPSLVKIHWRMSILECSQGCYRVKIWPWPWPLTLKINRFQILLRTKYVPSLVKIHWRMLILECSQGCYGRTDGSVTMSLRNFVGEGIITLRIGTIYNQTCIKRSPLEQRKSVLIRQAHFLWNLLWQDKKMVTF